MAGTINSNVTNVSEAEIMCLMFVENFGVISEVTNYERSLSHTR